MKRQVVEGGTVVIPSWVNDLESFRRWSDDADFPEKGRIAYLRGDLWVDMSMEELITHNDVKGKIYAALTMLVLSTRSGRCFADGAFVSNEGADISNQPDCMYASAQAFREGRVRMVESRQEGYAELEGTPDMVLEVVSTSSVTKDTKVLREAYAVAGIREYWLVDARKEPLRFDLLRLSRGAYVVTRKLRSGWARSEIFDHWFRLRQQEGPDGYPEFVLDFRAEKPT